ncbi:MAG: bifunctional riboflavin kinase/FAD synthetase [Actinomycetota bacterium]|nr:bifunctional riboflavin kinase/FAD synthetase [Actinomycetota bacterium]
MAKIINFKDLADNYFQKSINAVVIGFFDGIHKGHQDIIKKCIKRAKAIGGSSVALTFDIPPVNMLTGKKEKKLIIPFSEKIRMISDLGVDYIISIGFNNEFAGLSADDFCRKILIDKINAKEVFIGENFKFGKGAKGDYIFLKDFLKKYDKIVHVVKLLKINNIIVSSTVIRKLYAEGDIENIKLFLGRYPAVGGIVQKGFSRGTSMGFPTANIEIEDSYVMPKRGVYIGKIKIEGSSGVFPSVINIGNNPTFGYRKTVVEAHMLNFKNNIYSKKITVEFFKYLRDEIKFNLPQDLINQINIDIKNCIEYFKLDKRF